MTVAALAERPDSFARARAGDHDAFAELVAEHQSKVFSVAYHFFNDRDRAADVAQEVFLKLFRNLSRISDGDHATHWLLQTTAHQCIDELRRTRLRAVPIDEADIRPAEAAPGDPLMGKLLRNAVAALPEAQRIAVILRYQEELAPAEISRIAGIEVNTVKSQLQRALQALRRMLEGR